MDKNCWENEDVFGELQWTFQRKKRFLKDLQSVKNHEDLYNYIRPCYDDIIDLYEVAYVVYFNSSLKILGRYKHSTGSSSHCIVDNKDIIARALTLQAKALAIIHNHLSGGLKPSDADLNMTRSLRKACEVMGLNLIDSMIITEDNYKSILDL